VDWLHEPGTKSVSSAALVKHVAGITNDLGHALKDNRAVVVHASGRRSGSRKNGSEPRRLLAAEYLGRASS